MTYDGDYREAACAAIDTAYAMTAQGADTPGAFVVPAGAQRITEIRIGLGRITVDTVAQIASYVHIYGGGAPQLGEGWFAGPIAGVSGAAATSGGYTLGELQVYKTNIPVRGGGQINADAYVSGTDAGTAHMFLELVYDGMPGRIKDADIREGDLTAANTLVACQNRGGAASGDFLPSGTIVEVNIGVAMTPTGHATDGLVAASAFHLSGAGLAVAGNYKFLANCGFMEPDTDVSGVGATQIPLIRYETPGIPVKSGSSIRVQAQNIESAQAGNAIVCLCYA